MDTVQRSDFHSFQRGNHSDHREILAVLCGKLRQKPYLGNIRTFSFRVNRPASEMQSRVICIGHRLATRPIGQTRDDMPHSRIMRDTRVRYPFGIIRHGSSSPLRHRHPAHGLKGLVAAFARQPPSDYANNADNSRPGRPFRSAAGVRPPRHRTSRRGGCSSTAHDHLGLVAGAA